MSDSGTFKCSELWKPITEIPGIPQRTLRYWCESGKVTARKRKKVWEIFLPAILDWQEDPISEIDEVFREAAKVPDKPLPSNVDSEGTRKR